MPMQKMVTEKIRAAAHKLFLKQQAAMLEKTVRALALEKAIVAALRKHGARLRHGEYMDKVGTRGACVCAVGAALLARSKTKKDAQAFMKRLDERAVETFGGSLVHPMESRVEIMRWAAEVVDEGITEEDLKQLECGFEGGHGYSLLARPDGGSPFYQLGKKLAKRALKGRKDRV